LSQASHQSDSSIFSSDMACLPAISGAMERHQPRISLSHSFLQSHKAALERDGTISIAAAMWKRQSSTVSEDLAEIEGSTPSSDMCTCQPTSPEAHSEEFWELVTQVPAGWWENFYELALGSESMSPTELAIIMTTQRGLSHL